MVLSFYRTSINKWKSCTYKNELHLFTSISDGNSLNVVNIVYISIFVPNNWCILNIIEINKKVTSSEGRVYPLSFVPRSGGGRGGREVRGDLRGGWVGGLVEGGLVGRTSNRVYKIRMYISIVLDLACTEGALCHTVTPGGGGGWCDMTSGLIYGTVQRQTAVAAYFSSKQVLLYAPAQQCSTVLSLFVGWGP